MQPTNSKHSRVHGAEWKSTGRDLWVVQGSSSSRFINAEILTGLSTIDLSAGQRATCLCSAAVSGILPHKCIAIHGTMVDGCSDIQRRHSLALSASDLIGSCTDLRGNCECCGSFHQSKKRLGLGVQTSQRTDLWGLSMNNVVGCVMDTIRLTHAPRYFGVYVRGPS